MAATGGLGIFSSILLSHHATSVYHSVPQCTTAYVVSMPEMPWMPETLPDRLPIICLHDVRNVADVGVAMKLNYFGYSCEFSGTTTITAAVTKTRGFTMTGFLKDFKTSPLDPDRETAISEVVCTNESSKFNAKSSNAYIDTETIAKLFHLGP